MSRRYTLISLIPIVGEPLAFWLRNRTSIRQAAAGAKHGMREDGIGGALIGMVSGLAASDPDQPPGELREALDRLASDPATDPRLASKLRKDTGGAEPSSDSGD